MSFKLDWDTGTVPMLDYKTKGVIMLFSKQFVTLIVSIFLHVNSFAEMKQQNEDIYVHATSLEKLLQKADLLKLFSEDHFSLNTLPLRYMELINIKKTSSHIDKLLHKEILKYIEINRLIAECRINSKDLKALLDNSEKQAILLSLAYSQMNIHLLPLIAQFSKNKTVVYNLDGNEAFRLADFLGSMGSGSYDSSSFYTKKSLASLSENFIEMWLKPTGSGTDIKRFYEKRENGRYSTTALYLRFLRANHLETGNPDREEIQKIRKVINSLPDLDKLLNFIAISKTKVRYPMYHSSSENHFLNSHYKVSSQKESLLVTEKELLTLLGSIPKKTLEAVLTNLSPLVDNPDFEPKRGNYFYDSIVKYILNNRQLFWTDKEFEKIQNNLTVRQ